jgi:hypothetical protein
LAAPGVSPRSTWVSNSSKQEPLGQRGGQDQPSVGHRVVVVEGDGNRIGAVACSHRTGALLSPSR